jgi:hypothetical protein
LVIVAAALMLVLALIGMGACFAGIASFDTGPSRTCVDWDRDKVKVTVTPKPDRTYDRRQKRWENGPTPKPYVTTTTKVECEEWESSTP